MSLSTALKSRSDNQCELCTNNADLSAYLVTPKNGESDDDYIVICKTCTEELQSENLNEDHWRCLNESIWSTVPAVQVLSYRTLKGLATPWAQDLMNTMYMDETTQEWAETSDDQIIHQDSNGHILKNGDSVVLIQDLNVKGANFTAKRGTAVRRISLVQDNAEHIQGKINDQTIIILTKYVKKS